ncbi:hypothetical protein JYK02_23615 [Corallococcus macrosporus]|uniref:Uncharacterized protein n=1 Tax=Corallococcus macrosporus TaxID=35 RepID=A0ABS3DGR7_9BACT|nr:hypothetical protein [Corallococcus macrosporus]MBN8230505.1 hypothetical protein [Corallococcus macrosporus]
MADNKGDPIKGDERTDTQDAETLRREARHQAPDSERRDAADEDVGEDRILQKGIGGYGAQEGTEPERKAPPVRDNSKQ